MHSLSMSLRTNSQHATVKKTNSSSKLLILLWENDHLHKILIFLFYFEGVEQATQWRRGDFESCSSLAEAFIAIIALPFSLWLSKINPHDLCARQASNKSSHLENRSTVTVQYLPTQDTAWMLPLESHMYTYTRADIHVPV